VQRGPTFPHPIEVWIDGSTNQVTVRNTYDDGTEKVRIDHLDVPSDLANGIVLTLWILSGEAPAFVKSEGPLYLGGPIWRIELDNPAWPANSTDSNYQRRR
jgi:hypothetical protein